MGRKIRPMVHLWFRTTLLLGHCRVRTTTTTTTSPTNTCMSKKQLGVKFRKHTKVKSTGVTGHKLEWPVKSYWLDHDLSL